jgi:hypothetical protein
LTVKDERIDRSIKAALAGGEAASGSGCPADSVFAAYLDSKLQPDEMFAFESHCADCPSCRELLSLSLTLTESKPVARQIAVETERSPVFGFLFPISALALIIVAVLAGYLWRQSTRTEPIRTATETAANLPRPAKPSAETKEIAPSQVAPKADRPLEAKAKTSALPTPPVSAPARKMEEVASLPSARQGAEQPLETKAVSAAPAPPALADAVVPSLPVTAQAALPLRSDESRTEPVAALSGRAVGGILAPPGGSYSAQNRMKGAIAKDINNEKDLAEKKAEAPRAPKTVGDRTFSWRNQMWLDSRCEDASSSATRELKPDSSEISEIVKDYPELKDLRPLMICWKGNRLFIR